VKEVHSSFTLVFIITEEINMAKVTNIVEYPEDGIAIIEDTKGKYIATKYSPDIIPLYDFDLLKAYFGRNEPCALLQSRTAILT
jgi:hypothetical protein